MEIIKSKIDDLPQIMQIIMQAKNYFAKKTTFQWDKNYPNKSHIKCDIVKKNSYIVKNTYDILATFCLSVEKDEIYENIQNIRWISDGTYATIHRMAIDNLYKKMGVGSDILEYCEKYCRENNIKSLRIDTHIKNIPMINLIKKHNFTYCGETKTNDFSIIIFEKLC